MGLAAGERATARLLQQRSCSALSSGQFSGPQSPSSVAARYWKPSRGSASYQSQSHATENNAEGSASASKTKEDHVDKALLRFLVGKGGSVKAKLEKDFGVELSIPSSYEARTWSSILTNGSESKIKAASVAIQKILGDVVQSKLQYTHFISLPLASNPTLLEQVETFQRHGGESSPGSEEDSDGLESTSLQSNSEIRRLCQKVTRQYFSNGNSSKHDSIAQARFCSIPSSRTYATSYKEGKEGYDGEEKGSLPSPSVPLETTKPLSSTTESGDEATSVSEAPPSVNVEVDSAFKASPRHDMALLFTCTVCDVRSAKTMSRATYETGVVIVRCPGCQNLHLIADRYGWFGDPGSVEDFLAVKGIDVRKGSDGSYEFTVEDMSGWTPKGKV